MQQQPYNPVIARNIPLELAQVQRERGGGMTKSEFIALGYTTDQLTDANIAKAAEAYARLSNDRVAA